MSASACLAMFFALCAHGEDSHSPIKIDSPAVNGDEQKDVSDDTQKMISQLTIAMSAEVIDERTFAIRDTSKGSKHIHLRLGNVGPTPRALLEDGDYAEKARVAKAALGKLVDKQMIWYKPAPDSVQSSNSSGTSPVIFADVWSIDGKHLGNILKKEGHLSHELSYDTDLAKDILTVASEEEKKESYKKLEEALKESEKAKQDAAKSMRATAEAEKIAEDVESFGLSGWLGIAVVLVIAFGGATNFGRPSNKKLNPNRKRGSLERFWMKLKGA